MTFSLSSGKRRWACRAARRGWKRGAGCRHFHVHYHVPRQVWAFSPLRLPSRFSLLPYLLILPVLFFAVLAFLVCFGWFTLVYFLSSLWSKRNDHELCSSRSANSAGDASEPRGEDEREERAVKRVTEHAGDSGPSEVCVESQEIKEVFGDGFSEESRHMSRMASLGIYVNDKDYDSEEKIVEEVMLFETNKELKAFAELDGSSEKHKQVMDTPADYFLGEFNTREFSTSLNTAKLLDVEYGGEPVAKRKVMPVLSPLEILEFIDKHDTEEIFVNVSWKELEIPEVSSSDASANHGLGDRYRKEMKQEQSTAELSTNSSVSDGLAGDIVDECQQTQNLVIEHTNNLPENDSIEEDGEQILGTSDEAHDSLCETAGLPLDSVRKYESETVAASNSTFHPATTDQDGEFEEELNGKRVESSTSASAVCDFADNHWRIIEQLGGFASEESIHEEGLPEISGIQTVEDENDSDDKCTSTGASSRLPLVRRSPTQWWNLCGVLDAFAGGKD